MSLLGWLDTAFMVTGCLPLIFPSPNPALLLFSISSYLLNSLNTPIPSLSPPLQVFLSSSSLSLSRWFAFPDPLHVLLWQSLLKLCAEDSTTHAPMPSDLQDAWPCPGPSLSGVSASSQCSGIIKEHTQHFLSLSSPRAL